MKKPSSFRNEIPFFYNKTNTEFQKDIYERYDDMVVRQTALHLADELWGEYPFQNGLDLVKTHLPKLKNPKIVEIGCSVGRWIGELALGNSNGIFWGIDYSYQMLKRAHDFWIDHKNILLDLSHRGLGITHIESHQLKNLNFGLAKAEDLPFENESQDLVFSSFLFDRLDQPIVGLQEMHRILKKDGTLILITPLNFLQKNHWEQFHPPVKLFPLFQNQGFQVLEWEEAMIFDEPLDRRNNILRWNCLSVVTKKS